MIERVLRNGVIVHRMRVGLKKETVRCMRLIGGGEVVRWVELPLAKAFGGGLVGRSEKSRGCGDGRDIRRYRGLLKVPSKGFG